MGDRGDLKKAQDLINDSLHTSLADKLNQKKTGPLFDSQSIV